MAAVSFDTLKLSRSLREKAKLSPEQAEGFADALSEAVQNDLATKSDLDKVRTDLTGEIGKVRSDLTAEIGKVRTEMTSEFVKVRTEIDLLRSEMKTEIAVAKADLLKWSIGQTLVILGAMLALVRFVGRF